MSVRTTDGAAINLTYAQALQLARIIENHKYSIRIVDKGDGWFEVERIDENGETVSAMPLPPQ
jgi:hypothetical protein